MRIVAIHEGTLPISSSIRNAWIDFATMDCSIVAVVSDVIRNGRPLIGYGFTSNGRYSQGELLRRRFIPRVLGADPSELLDQTGALDPAEVWSVAMRNEKPGGHGERPAAVGVLDMAVHDLAAKIAGEPLYRYLARRYHRDDPDPDVFVYAAGGYYTPTKSLGDLQDEMRGYLDLGYTVVKMKIGGAALADDLRRIDAVLDVVEDPSRLAVDANGRFDLATALAYSAALQPYGLYWFEEPGDPLDYELHRRLTEQYTGTLATGENLFSLQDVRNLLRYGGMRPERDVVQVDPVLSYGAVEYFRILALLDERGWSPRRCMPHGGHQFALHLAAAAHLGGNESYPGEFQPAGGFADDAQVIQGRLAVGEDPGIGLERKNELYRALRALHD